MVWALFALGTYTVTAQAPRRVSVSARAARLRSRLPAQAQFLEQEVARKHHSADSCSNPINILGLVADAIFAEVSAFNDHLSVQSRSDLQFSR